MTLFKENNDGKIPANAKIITKQEILSVYQKIFQTWNPKSEIRAITNGPVALGVSSALTGMYINNYFRRKLRLGLFGQFSSYLPIVIIPTIVTSMFHQMVCSVSIHIVISHAILWLNYWFDFFFVSTCKPTWSSIQADAQCAITQIQYSSNWPLVSFSQAY